MAILNKKQILEAEDKKTVEVEVPEWGGSVIVSTISGTARDAFEQAICDSKGNYTGKNIRAKLLIASCVDNKGGALFTKQDIVALGAKSSAALDRLFSAAQKLNAVTDEDVEELAKN